MAARTALSASARASLVDVSNLDHGDDTRKNNVLVLTTSLIRRRPLDQP